jgi:hypothetical protein
MSGLPPLDVLTDTELSLLLREHREHGTPKSHIEKRHGDDSSNGQHISALWRERLGVETVRPSPLAVRHAEAVELLRQVVERDWHEGWSKRAHDFLEKEKMA